MTSSSSSSVFYWDAAAPQAYDIRIRRSFDGVWSDMTCTLPQTADSFCQDNLRQLVLNDTSQLAVRFYISEPVPTVNITTVEYAIGTTVGGTDVLDWESLGRASQLENKSSEPYTLEVDVPAGALKHRGRYYLSIHTVNSRSLEQIFTSPAFFFDETPPNLVYVRGYWERDTLFWRLPMQLTPGWQFNETEDESSIMSHVWRLRKLSSEELVQPETDVGVATTATYSGGEAFEHGEVYCTEVRAQNLGGTWTEWMSNCTTMDFRNPIFNALGPIVVDPLKPYDDWPLYVASQLASESFARAVQRNRTDAFPEGLLDVTEWDQTEVTASRVVVPYVNRSFHYEALWDLEDTGDFFPLLTESMGDASYIIGQRNFQVIRLRWGQGDIVSGIDYSKCFLSLGTGRGDSDVIEKLYFPIAQHVYDLAFPSGNASAAWATSAQTPGIYNVVSTGFGYYEALVRYDPTGLNGLTLYRE